MSIGNKVYENLKGDRGIWAIMILLSLISILVVYSATGTIAYKEKGGNTEFYLIKHSIILLFGFGITYTLYRIPYQKYAKIAPYLFMFSIPLLMFTLGFGVEINDAKRWIRVPFIGITVQTSDFAKIALILYLARSISAKQENIRDFRSAFLPIILPIIIVCGLIAPDDLSSALLLFLTSFLLMFVGRVHWHFLVLLLFLGIVVFAFLIIVGHFFPGLVRVETWITRIQEFLTNSDGGFQIKQAKIAMANGEWFGVGPGNSTQRNFVPAPYSDFIYSILIEEWGMLGGAFIVFLYFGLLWRTVHLVTNSPKAFGALVSIGLTLLLVVQAFANMAVSVQLVPVTGLTLPMVSLGGTSLLFTSVSFGIILSFSRYIEKVKLKKRAALVTESK